MNIGNAVKRAREKRNLTQTQLAEKLEVSSAYISAIEKSNINGKKTVSLKQLAKICEVLDIPVELLLLNALRESEELLEGSEQDRRSFEHAAYLLNSIFT